MATNWSFVHLLLDPWLQMTNSLHRMNIVLSGPNMQVYHICQTLRGFTLWAVRVWYMFPHYLESRPLWTCGVPKRTSSESDGQDERRGEDGRGRGIWCSSLGDVEAEEVTDEPWEGTAPKDLTEAQEDRQQGPESGDTGAEDTGALRMTLVPEQPLVLSCASESAVLGMRLTMHLKGKHKLEASSFAIVGAIQL